MSIKTVYYSHPKVTKNSNQARADVIFLELLGFQVENPYHSKYQDCWEELGISFGRTLVELYDAIAFRPTEDERISAGVAKELKWAVELNKTIFKLPQIEEIQYTVNDIEELEMSIEETVHYFKTFKE